MINTFIRFCIIIFTLFFITLCLIRYQADIYYNHAQQSRHLIHKWIHNAELAVKYNPIQREYNNSLAFAYLNMAIKLGKNEQWSHAWSYLLKAISIGKWVQQCYPGDYRSAYILKRSYTALNMLSQEDMGKYIDKYNKIMKHARPLSTQ